MPEATASSGTLLVCEELPLVNVAGCTHAGRRVQSIITKGISAHRENAFMLSVPQKIIRERGRK